MMRKITLAAVATLSLAACDSNFDNGSHVEIEQSSGSPVPAETIDPSSWPKQDPVMVRDAEMEAAIQDLISRMTLEEKVGQVIQADIASVTPEEVREYNLGSILNGGGSAPGGDNRTAAENWLALADEFWLASTDTSDGGVGIPALWGTDAVHGHSNIVGATLFPHNIGLGMANDPDMMEAIGRATALEMRVTGMDWTFAPTIAVVRNDRWGRTYESYSEDPAIVTAYAPRIVEGLQGKYGTPDFLANGHLMATAKHFAGDGGTIDGRDQGENNSTEAVFREQQAAAYPPAIAAGVQSVMASFNSYHGRKMHGHKEMLTDVLVGRMGFDGFTVGDWNGHGQVAGCTNTSCAASFNAGLDMFMAPDSWKGLYASLLEDVQSGAITLERLHEAVGRILRVKMRTGLFEAGLPSERPFAGDYEILGSPEHRAIARDAVRKSLVLLKNQGDILPLSADTRVLMTGEGAHNIGKQSGGWTLTWQGTGNEREHFPNGASIYEGFVEALGEENVFLSEDGGYSDRPDVAIVVFGEDPYAEFQGDRLNVDYADDDGHKLLNKYKQAGIPTVSIFITGRPLFVNPEINRSDAFVVAWLPGTEGAGVADVMVASAGNAPNYNFHGKLSFSWPKSAAQEEVNIGDPDYDPQFAYGYGIRYGENGDLPMLPEDSGLGEDSAVALSDLMAYGDPLGEWSLLLRDAEGDTRIGDSRGGSAAGAVTALPADRDVQEDTLLVTWTSQGSMLLEGRPANFFRESNGGLALQITYRVLDAPAGDVLIQMGEGDDVYSAVDVTASMTARAGQGWQTSQLLLSCFSDAINMESIRVPLMISSTDTFSLQIASSSIAPTDSEFDCRL